ncbi:MAG: hypothetical protein HC895_07735 [Leptolyngbyaceae cyanobacterium SM1_3_5]|nr:hypothetical protein [Leptolyngbyaceae cyanobacterium SM1_3_5]
MFAAVSHELRTPLSNIKMALQLLNLVTNRSAVNSIYKFFRPSAIAKLS